MSPEVAVEDERLSDGAYRLLNWLIKWLRRNPGRYPTLHEAASLLHYSVSKISRAYRQLEATGYLIRRACIAGRRQVDMAFNLGAGSPRLAPPPSAQDQLPLFPDPPDERSSTTNMLITNDQDSGHPRPACWSSVTTPPDPLYKETELRTTTTEGPSPSSSSSLDEDRVQALGARVDALWGYGLEYAVGRVRGWLSEFPGGLDWVERAVEGAEDSQGRARNDGWIANRLIAWRDGTSHVPPPRPAPTPAPAERHWGGPTVPDPPPGHRYVPSQGNPLPRRAAYKLEPIPPRETPPPPVLTADEAADFAVQARIPGLDEGVRRQLIEAIEAAVEAAVVGREVLDGLDRPSPRKEKAGRGSHCHVSPRPAPMPVSRGDSSVYRGTEQVSLREPALRSDLSARDLLPCSRESSFPPNPAAPGGG